MHAPISDVFVPNRAGEKAIHFALALSSTAATVTWLGVLGWAAVRLLSWAGVI